MRYSWALFVCLALAAVGPFTALRADEAVADAGLSVASFEVDVTPPLGSPLCNGSRQPAVEITTPLTARGLLLLGAGDPIVLCAVDWVGIANESHDRFCQAIAEAVGTSVDRVTLHTLHQHDAPGTDFATERLLAEHGLGGLYSNADFDAQVMRRLADAAKTCLQSDSNTAELRTSAPQPVTHIGLGKAKVEKVASNRRILGSNGKVVLQRQSSGGRNPKARAAPEGTIDPYVASVAFFNADQAVAVLTYYATHPQSYYGNGKVNWDFVGIARQLREQALPDVRHVHFDGAGGNVAAGKYNDGSPEKRPLLAERLADGMKRAWQSQTKHAITAEDVGWRTQAVRLPVRETLVEADLMDQVTDEDRPPLKRIFAARALTFVRRTQQGRQITLSCLELGPARILHMPGELFIEYQLAAQRMRPDAFVAMAAYGEYGAGYIGTEIAYGQGGYETGYVSRVAPQVESVLTEALASLLEVPSDRVVRPSEIGSAE